MTTTRRPELRRFAREHLTRVQRLEEALFSHPFVRIPIAILLFTVARFLTERFAPPSTFFSRPLILLGAALATAYFILLVLYVLRRSLTSLFTAKSFWSLVASYVLLIVSILFLFASAYAAVDDMDRGYLTYGTCGDAFDPATMAQDVQRSESYFYFSATTFFTVGYGDICPMGLAKSVSILNAFAGNLTTVVIMGIVLAVFLERRAKGR